MQLLTFLVLSIFALSRTRHAQAAFDIGAIFGQGAIAGGIRSFSTVTRLVNPIYWSIITIIALVILADLIYGGFMYIMGAGKADKKQIQQGMDAITWGFIGLAVVFSAFWIIRIVEIMTGMSILNSTI